MNKKMNNKGFSLVELIIVIAIMAILIGVLAPAYLKYVEKSRKSTDADAIASILNAMETVTLDPEYEKAVIDSEKDKVCIRAYFDSNNALKFGGDSDSNATLNDACSEIIGAYSLKSSDWKDGNLVAITATKRDGGRLEFDIQHKAGYTGTTVMSYSLALETKVNNSKEAK